MAREAVYVGVWIILVIATVLELAMLYMQAPLTLLLAGIAVLASLKAILIALYYQHLRYEPAALSAIPISGLALLIILVVTMVAGG